MNEVFLFSCGGRIQHPEVHSATGTFMKIIFIAILASNFMGHSKSLTLGERRGYRQHPFRTRKLGADDQPTAERQQRYVAHAITTHLRHLPYSARHYRRYVPRDPDAERRRFLFHDEWMLRGGLRIRDDCVLPPRRRPLTRTSLVREQSGGYSVLFVDNEQLRLVPKIGITSSGMTRRYIRARH